MSDPISEGLGLAREVFGLLNTKEANKYIDRSVELELQLIKELAKPYGRQNDKKIVSLRKEFAVIMRAAIQQVKNERAKR